MTQTKSATALRQTDWVDHYRDKHPAVERWAVGYGPISHSTETQARVFLLTEQITSGGSASDDGVGIGRDDFFNLLSALDRVASAGMWLVVNGVYARNVYLDGDEFQVAGIGPLTSLVLAGIAGLVWYFGRSAGLSIPVVAVAAYLAWVNTLLVVFNLLPGFPLDGGRLFRSIIWRATGNLKRATRIASKGGQILGFGMIALGFLQLFSPTPNFIGGLWFILIGWFLNNAAQSSYQDLVVRMMLEGTRVDEVMTYDPETVPANLNLQEFLDNYLFNRNYQSFPVESDGHPIGLITLEQVRQTPRQDWQQSTVRDIMKPVEAGITVDPDRDMSSVLEQMQDNRTRRLLVTTDGHLEGILSASDIANWLQRQRTFGDVVARQNRPLKERFDQLSAAEQG